MLLTRSPLIHGASTASSFDLHVLSTPPAFVLSQDQTLRKENTNHPPQQQAIQPYGKQHPQQVPSPNPEPKTRVSSPKKSNHQQAQTTQPPQRQPNSPHPPKRHRQTNTLLSSQTTTTHPTPHQPRRRMKGVCSLCGRFRPAGRFVPAGERPEASHTLGAVVKPSRTPVSRRACRPRSTSGRGLSAPPSRVHIRWSRGRRDHRSPAP